MVRDYLEFLKICCCMRLKNLCFSQPQFQIETHWNMMLQPSMTMFYFFTRFLVFWIAPSNLMRTSFTYKLVCLLIIFVSVLHFKSHATPFISLWQSTVLHIILNELLMVIVLIMRCNDVSRMLHSFNTFCFNMNFMRWHSWLIKFTWRI